MSASDTGGVAGGRRAATMLCVLLLFGAETVFAALLPLYGERIPHADPFLLGAAISVSSGAGFLLLPFFGRALGEGMLRRTGVVCALCMMAALVLLWWAPGAGAVSLIVGSLVFGAARIVAVVGLLGLVAGLPGDTSANQGWNGGAQRLGSVLALLGAGAFLASGNWDAVFVSLLLLVLCWGVGFASLTRGAGAARTPVSETPGGAIASAYACVRALRTPGVAAAAALNILVLLTLMHGNSFFVLAFGGVAPPSVPASSAILMIVVRDGMAVLTGICFPVVRRLVDMRAILAGLVVLTILPFVVLAFPWVPPLFSGVFAAVLHGMLVGGGIAASNLLAVGGATAGATSRIAASQLPAGAVLLVAPLLFSALLGSVGRECAYLVLVCIAAFAGWIMLRATRSPARVV